jgi:Raf kinase inhibitor-like YbhB/YbcL family protein
MAFSVTSTSFRDGDYLALDHVLSENFGFGCAGQNVSPQLSWSGAPDGTQSFAVTCFDPDAPTGSGFWHWVVCNIPPNVTSLDAGASPDKMPAGALEVRNDYSQRGYGGPCPPEGDHPHRYLFTVFAVGLDALQADENTSPAVIGFQLHFNTLAKATLMGLFKR